MSTSKAKLQTSAKRLRVAIAEGEARLEIDRAKLLRIEAQLGGPAAPPSGMDLLWAAAPKMSQERSSPFKCRAEFNKIPLAERPKLEVMIAALKLWARCNEWRNENGKFIPALDRWIKERRWEAPPADTAAPSRARQPAPKPITPVAADEAITDRDEVRRMLGLRPTDPKATAPTSIPPEAMT